MPQQHSNPNLNNNFLLFVTFFPTIGHFEVERFRNISLIFNRHCTIPIQFSIVLCQFQINNSMFTRLNTMPF